MIDLKNYRQGKGRRLVIAASAALLLSLILSLACMAAGLFTRFGLWDFRFGLTLLKWSVYGELAAAVLSLSAALFSLRAKAQTALLLSTAGLLISIIAVSLPLYMGISARRLPLIHDITTDTINPPRFDKVLPLREGAPNTAEYGGPEVAEKQRRAYTGIAPLFLSLPPEVAFRKALETASAMGWVLVNASPEALIIEGTDTTFWFGFKDDIVIRVSPHAGRSRIDVRSVSRAGRSDVGANAKRIRAFLKRLSRLS